MKNILLVVFVLFTGLQVVAQEENQWDENKVYNYVQKKAQPKETLQMFYDDFINKFQTDGIDSEVSEVRLILKFVVEKDGSFSDVTNIVTLVIEKDGAVVNNTMFGRDKDAIGKEAIRVLKTMPAWQPAQHNCKYRETESFNVFEIEDCKIVRSRFTLPIKIPVN